MAGTAPAATLLIRIAVGGVFISEGIQKFIFPEALGVGRFVKIGIPAPGIVAPFVGVVEVVCGVLVLVGMFTRVATVPLIIDMSVAIYTTKMPMLLKDGFWKMAHEARTDWAMLLGSVFLLLAGAGRLSGDARIFGSDNNRDRDAFGLLWRAWKAGKGKAQAEAEKAMLLATAKAVLGLDGTGACEASRRFLTAVRSDVVGRVAADAPASAGATIRLFRGLRGGGGAEAFRETRTVAGERLLSYTTDMGAAETFAGMGSADGLVYQLDVPQRDIVFYEDASLCGDFVVEKEVLVLHAVAPHPGQVTIVNESVPRRAKLQFGSKKPNA
jgi:putative oxidoreductase